MTTITSPTHTNRLVEYHKEPSPVSLDPLEQSPPTPIKPRSDNYSAVNNLAILPDELRTPENLEPGHLAQENAQQLIDDYLKKREEYEETQLLANQPMSFSESNNTKENISPIDTRAPTAEIITQPFVNAANAAPGYEDVEPLTTIEPLSKSAPQRLVPSNYGYEDANPPVSSTPRIGDYNNPIDYLPEDHFLLDSKLKVGTPGTSSKIVSTSVDEYSEVFDRRGDGGNMIILPKVRAMSDSKPVRDVSRKKSSGNSPTRPEIKYENGPLGGSSYERPAASMDSVDRITSNKQFKRDDTKEVVELDFTKKKFRVASTKRSKDVTDGDVSPPAKVKEDYAMVNLADKRCYRAESDSCKQDGSGIPLHYGPEATPTPVVAVPT